MSKHPDGHETVTEADVLAFVQHHSERLGCRLSARSDKPAWYYGANAQAYGLLSSLAEVEQAIAANTPASLKRAELDRLEAEVAKVRAELERLST